MKTVFLTIFSLFFAVLAHGAIIEFDISPPGTAPGVGLSPLNEVIPGPSTGSGGEVGDGIFLDTITLRLTFNLAYGSVAGFSDLSGPAFSWLLHGPAPLGETAPVLFDLAPFHTFASDPTRGGRISGSLALDSSQSAGLLAGLNYVNIYTPANLGGELRGQLVVVPEPRTTLLLVAAGALAILRRTLRPRR